MIEWELRYNPNMKTNYKVGDEVIGSEFYIDHRGVNFNIYTILHVEERERFGRLQQLLTVDVRVNSDPPRYIERNITRWATQLV